MSYHESTLKPYPTIFVWRSVSAYVVDRLFWRSRGMTVQMLVCRETILAITIILRELPTGTLADRFGGRKPILFAAGLLRLGYLLIPSPSDKIQLADGSHFCVRGGALIWMN